MNTNQQSILTEIERFLNIYQGDYPNTFEQDATREFLIHVQEFTDYLDEHEFIEEAYDRDPNEFLSHPSFQNFAKQIRSDNFVSLLQSSQDQTELNRIKFFEEVGKLADQALVKQSDVDQTEVEQSGVDQADVDPTDVDQTGLEQSGVDPTDVEPTNLEQSGVDQAGVDQAGVDPTDVEPTNLEQSGVDQAGVDQAGVDPTDVEPTNLEQSGVEQTDVEQSDVDQTDVDPTDVDPTNLEQSGVEQTDVEQSGVDQADVDPTDVSVVNQDNKESKVPAWKALQQKAAEQIKKNLESPTESLIEKAEKNHTSVNSTTIPVDEVEAAQVKSSNEVDAVQVKSSNEVDTAQVKPTNEAERVNAKEVAQTFLWPKSNSNTPIQGASKEQNAQKVQANQNVDNQEQPLAEQTQNEAQAPDKPIGAMVGEQVGGFVGAAATGLVSAVIKGGIKGFNLLKNRNGEKNQKIENIDELIEQEELRSLKIGRSIVNNDQKYSNNYVNFQMYVKDSYSFSKKEIEFGESKVKKITFDDSKPDFISRFVKQMNSKVKTNEDVINLSNSIVNEMDYLNDYLDEYSDVSDAKKPSIKILNGLKRATETSSERASALNKMHNTLINHALESNIELDETQMEKLTNNGQEVEEKSESLMDKAKELSKKIASKIKELFIKGLGEEPEQSIDKKVAGPSR